MRAKRELDEREITGLKHLGRLLPLLERLHEVGCARDKAGNRLLHMDQYCALVLLFLFNPVLTSVRSIQQASELKKVQKQLGCSRASLGSLSEATRVFDPELLREIIGELADGYESFASTAAGGLRPGRTIIGRISGAWNAASGTLPCWSSPRWRWP